MDNYIPPFDITNIMLDRISSIMKKVGKLDNYKDLNKMPVLRRNNRIRSIHSSLAIEANSLSFDQVKDIIDGKKVIGPQDEIQEVKNAYEAYKLIKMVNQYSIKDLKKIHGVMTYLTVDESGEFRKGNEGVFDENGNCIHVCPPPENCDHNGNSTEFIEFMLKMIDETLEDLMDSTSVQANHVSSYVNKLLDVMETGVAMTASELMEKLNMKSRISFRDNYLNPALENGLIKMTNPDKPTSKNQMYFKV